MSDFGEKFIENPQEDTTLLNEMDVIRNLVVYNDDYNTFDNVIDVLQKVCGHDHLQAVQCAYIIHYKGKCVVKEGLYTHLKPLNEAIMRKGVQSRIV